MKLKYRHIHFKQIRQPRGKDTTRWECRDSAQQVLGSVSWHYGWRQYALFADKYSMFSRGQLEDIRQFVQQLTDDRKSRKLPAPRRG